MSCDCSYDYDATNDCVDAWDLEKYYSCYESPNPVTNCEDISIGDLLEFNQGGERMWGIVVEICSCPLCCDFVVEVTTDLQLFHPFSTGDRVLINIICIYNHVIAEENKPLPDDSKCQSPYSLPCN